MKTVIYTDDLRGPEIDEVIKKAFKVIARDVSGSYLVYFVEEKPKERR